ncbi:MAG: MATE family efflux transporter [bacterium]|nr:MATE family efflux transporter [bacterium]
MKQKNKKPNDIKSHNQKDINYKTTTSKGGQCNTKHNTMPSKIEWKTEWKNISKMAYPILLNYLLTNLFELLDKAIIGHYSVRGFAVAGTAASAVYAVTGALGILSVSFHIVAADKKGKQDEEGFETAFFFSKTLALIIGVCFFTASILGGRFFFHRIYDIQRNDLTELLSYFYPAAFTVLQNMLIFQYSAYFRNCLNTRITLLSTILSTGVNIFFDASLVYGLFGLPQLGTSGAAWGSVIGLSAGLLVYQTAYYQKRVCFCAQGPIWFFQNILQPLFRNVFQNNIQSRCQNRFQKRFQKEFSKESRCKKEFALLKEILKTYPSLLGQELLENTIFLLIVSGVIARLGTRQMAVYHLLDTLGSLTGLPIYAYASATQTFALQNHSAGNRLAVKRYLKSGILLASGVIFSLSILCTVFQTKILYWIVTDSETIAASRQFLPLVFAVQIAKIPYQIYMNYLQGIGKERFVFVCTAFGTIVAGLGILILAEWIGLPAVYFILLLEFGTLTIVYLKQSANS